MRDIPQILGLLVDGGRLELSNGWAVVHATGAYMHPVDFESAQEMLEQGFIYLAGFSGDGQVARYGITLAGRDTWRSAYQAPTEWAGIAVWIIAALLLALILYRTAVLLFQRPVP